jgi:glycerol-3-phosphate dehydrogenase
VKYDVIIIGAGAVGCAVARELSRFELSVLCLEKEADVFCDITKANTGIIHSPWLVPSGTKKALYGSRGGFQFEELAADPGFWIPEDRSACSGIFLRGQKGAGRIYPAGQLGCRDRNSSGFRAVRRSFCC